MARIGASRRHFASSCWAQQLTERNNSKAADVGSWPKDNRQIGEPCGKLGTTASACLTLEVYYRYLPLYKRESDKLEK